MALAKREPEGLNMIKQLDAAAGDRGGHQCVSPATSPSAGFSFHLGHCPKNRHGLLWNTSIASRSLCPRRRNSSIVSLSHCGPLSPQSLAEFTQSIFVPYISMMSAARCGVTLLTG